MSDVRGHFRRKLEFLAALLPIIIFTLWLVSLWISRPLVRLCNVAGEIREGKMDTRAEVAGSDEIGLLAESFNEMVSRLAEREQALRESEERYRAIAEDMSLMICRFLPGGEITFVNEAYCEYFSKTFAELVGSNFLSLIPEADRQAVMANISALTVESPMQSHEHRVIAPDGAVRWQRWTNRAMFDAQGNVVAYQSIGEDVTERNLAEEALKDSEAKLLQAQYIARIGNFTWNIASGDATWSAGMYRLLKYDEGEEIDYEKVNAEVHHPDDLERVTKWLLDGIDSGNEVLPPNEYRLVCKDGEVLHVHTNGQVEYQDGRAVRIFGTCQDVTERKRVEEKLQASEENYRTIFDSGHDAIVVHDMETGAILDVNQRMCEMFGYSHDEALSLTVEDISLGELSYTRKDAAEWIRKAATQGPQTFEWICKRKSGEAFWVEVTLKRVMIAGHERVLATDRDITERKHAEQERQAQVRFLENLEQVNRAIRQADDVETMLQDVVETVSSILDSERAWLALSV